jgi:hypothetical protein
VPQVSGQFGPIYQNVTLNGSGIGQVSFQATGSAIRVSNIFFRVSTQVAQAVCTIYKGQVADGNMILLSNSGSTGGNAKGNVDLFDGETVIVRWTGGDAGAIATATFTGQKINFSDIKSSELTFEDPIAAGDGSLIFPALKSPNFSAGVSGWRISRNGDAEFNNVVIRGEVDINGNNNSYIRIYTAAQGGGVNAAVYEYDPGKYSDNAFPDPGAGQIIGKTFTTPDHRGSLQLVSPLSGTAAGSLYVSGASEESGTNDTQFLVDTTYTVLDGSLQIGTLMYSTFYGGSGYNLGFGVVLTAGDNTSTVAISTAETIVSSTTSFTFKKGRAYRATMSSALTFSAVPNRAVSRLRKHDIVGTQLGLCGHPGSNTGTGAAGGAWSTCFYVSSTGSDVTDNLVWTGIVNAGAVTVVYNGAADAPRSMIIEDIGDASIVSSWAPQLV